MFFFSQILVTWIFRETKLRFMVAIMKRNIFDLVFFLVFFLIYDVLGVYTYDTSFVPKFLQESTQNGWVQVYPPPLVHKREWKVA